MAIINQLPPDSFSFPIGNAKKAPTEWKLIVPQNATLNPFRNSYSKDIVFGDGEFLVYDGSDYRYTSVKGDLTSAWYYTGTAEQTELDFDNWAGGIFPAVVHNGKFFTFMNGAYEYCFDEYGDNVDYGYKTRTATYWQPTGGLGLSTDATCSCVWKDKIYVFDTSYCYYGIDENGNYNVSASGGLSVATSDGIMVVSTGSGIRYSTNGKNFTTKTFSSMGLSGVSKVSGLTYGNGVFVGISKNTNIAVVSNDGINWQKITLPFTDTTPTFYYGRNGIVPITFGNGYFVYIKNNNNCAYSKDGVNWTTFTIDNVSSFNATDIAYGNGKFVVVTNTANIALECEF